MGYSALLQPEFSVGGMGDPVQTEREIYNIMEDSDDSNQMRHPEGRKKARLLPLLSLKKICNRELSS